ncbi:FMN-linked oxidoreductase [Trametes maxima]|nr:FMN-linked oxidoreductase [Trametes maxima]
MAQGSFPFDLSTIAAPMVNQSDLPFRILVRRHKTSLVYTQMLLPERLLNDQEYLEFHTRGLRDYPDTPVVVQLCGNDPETVVKAARKVVCNADAIDLNLGCPQESARDGHYGGYLLNKKDWPLVESIGSTPIYAHFGKEHPSPPPLRAECDHIEHAKNRHSLPVSALSNSLPVPVSAKLRLCQNTATTPDLGARLEAAGAAWLTLHARHVSARRRRQGAADLAQVRALKERVAVPVVSNGNVRVWEDVGRNAAETGADGVMVGEALLANPCLFAGITPDPVAIALEYLEICRAYPGTATIQTVQTHVRHFVDHQCGRRPWYSKFRAVLGGCGSLDEIETLLRVKVQRWRGLAPLVSDETLPTVLDVVDSDDEQGDTEAGGAVPEDEGLDETFTALGLAG